MATTRTSAERLQLASEADATSKTVLGLPWIAVQPRSQEGGPSVAHTGPTWDSSVSQAFPKRASIRMLTDRSLIASWEQSERNADYIVAACNGLPDLVAALREAETLAAAERTLRLVAHALAMLHAQDAERGDRPPSRSLVRKIEAADAEVRAAEQALRDAGGKP